MRSGARATSRIASLRAVAQRFSFVALLMAAIAILMVGKIDAPLLDLARTEVSDAVAPILGVVAKPVDAVGRAVDEVRSLTNVRQENERLRAELAQLLWFKAEATWLRSRVVALRSLLNFRPDQPHTYITARVIADNSGAYVRSVGLNAGALNGVRNGLTVLGGKGMVGRTVQTGDRSSRVLLLSDLNSRIPVMIAKTSVRGVAAGDNSEFPRLTHRAHDGTIADGARVVTSGDGGLFPFGLPLGTTRTLPDGTVLIVPHEDLSRLDIVTLVDFSTEPPDGWKPRQDPGYVPRGLTP